MTLSEAQSDTLEGALYQRWEIAQEEGHIPYQQLMAQMLDLIRQPEQVWNLSEDQFDWLSGALYDQEELALAQNVLGYAEEVRLLNAELRRQYLGQHGS